MRGGHRTGSGRPLKYGEKTVAVRLPVSVALEIQELLRGRAKTNPVVLRPTQPHVHIPSITKIPPEILPVEPQETTHVAPGETFQFECKWYKLDANVKPESGGVA